MAVVVTPNKEIDKCIKSELMKFPEKKKLKTTDKPYKRINKNAPKVKDLNQASYKYFGVVDLMAIE